MTPQQKTDLRQIMRNRIRLLSPAERASASNALVNQLWHLPRIQAAGTVGIYLPLPDEPDLLPLWHRLLKAGKSLALPLPTHQDFWAFHRVTALTPLQPGPMGTASPPIAERIPPEALDLIVIPGRAFTQSGARLGRGKGIYDRLLATSKAYRIGVGFSCQCVDTLPQEDHDQLMHQICLGPTP